MSKGDYSNQGKMHGKEPGGFEDIKTVMWWLQRSRGEVLSVWQHRVTASTDPHCSSPTETVKL